MNEAKVALLRDRSVVSVTGEDATKLLQGIITNDMDELDTQPALFAGLLSPQGKVLFDFFVVKASDGYLLDTAADKAADLAKRLTMYKLRARATIADQSDQFKIAAAWGLPWGSVDGVLSYADPRDRRIGERLLVPTNQVAILDSAIHKTGGDWVHAPPELYKERRISKGVPEGGKDYDFGDAFPHEANFDLNNGVAFEKGCYVGQEIVSRMQHRATVRKRIVRVTATSDLPGTRSEVKMGEVVIGKLGSVWGICGLAMLRLDRAIESIDKGETITADGIVLTVDPEALTRHRTIMAEKASHT